VRPEYIHSALGALPRLTQRNYTTVMVAYNPRSPRDDSRSLSSAVAAQLRSALGAHWAEAEGYDAEIAAALTALAQDARARGLRPEELLLSLKAIERDVAATLELDEMQDRDRFRTWLVGACMRAFFAEDTTSDS
jgi:hypothetical protein